MNHESILQENLKAAPTALQITLGNLRKNLGFRSSRAFYEQYLHSRTRLDFNYSYYMKIEGGKITPSAQIISNLCAALEEDSAREVMLSYCETLFPERAGIFQKAKVKEAPHKIAAGTSQPQTPSHSGSGQTFLTQAQIACVCKSKYYYFTFLILTLARRSISFAELKTVLPKPAALDAAEIENLVLDLTRAKLVRVLDEQIESIAHEMKFPSAETPAQKKLYAQMDLWNIAFHHEMNFESLLQKMMVRRVSARYLSVIQAHCNVMIDLIRASDEINPEHNDDVLMLNVSIQRGRLPG